MRSGPRIPHCHRILLLAISLSFFPARAVAASPQDPDLVVLVARGAGQNVSEATKDACRAAVEAAMGGLIDAETRLLKGELFERVVMSTAGSIEKVDVIAQSQHEGLVRVTIRASVKRNLMFEKVAAFRESTARTDGLSLAAKLRSQREGDSASAEIASKLLHDWPLKLLRAETDGTLHHIATDGNAELIGVSVKVSLSDDAWSALRPALAATLRQAATQATSIESPPAAEQFSLAEVFGEDEGLLFPGFSIPSKVFALPAYGAELIDLPTEPSRRTAVIVLPHQSQHRRLDIYAVRTELARTLFHSTIAPKTRLIVEFLDAQNVTVAQASTYLPVQLANLGDGIPGRDPTERNARDRWVVDEARRTWILQYLTPTFEKTPFNQVWKSAHERAAASGYYMSIDPRLTFGPCPREDLLVGLVDSTFEVRVGARLNLNELERVTTVRTRLEIQN